MNKKIPMRQCVGCGEMKNKREMMRVLKTPEGPIVLDATGRKNGRGAYLCKSLDCLKKARKNRGLERSFQMSIPDEVYDSLEKEFGESETEYGIFPAGACDESRTDGKRGVHDRKICQEQNRSAGDRRHRRFSEYKEKFPGHVQLLSCTVL